MILKFRNQNYSSVFNKLIESSGDDMFKMIGRPLIIFVTNSPYNDTEFNSYVGNTKLRRSNKCNMSYCRSPHE